VSGPAVADRYTFKTRPLEDSPEQPEHLLIVIDHEDDITMSQRGADGRLFLCPDLVRDVHG
jgi:hypothetical protein